MTYYVTATQASILLLNDTYNRSYDQHGGDRYESQAAWTLGDSILFYSMYIVAVTITLLTVVGNVLVIIAVIKEKRLRKVGNVFIINLAVSDFLVGVAVAPMAIAYDVNGKWTLGNMLCDLWISLDVISCTASILNLCAIGYDRYNAIIQPMKYARKRTFSRAMVIVVIVWIYSLLIAAPRYLGWRNDDEHINGNVDCFISKNFGYTLYSTLGAFFIPLIVMMFFYFKIYMATRVRKRSWKKGRGHCKYISETVREEPSFKPTCSCIYNCLFQRPEPPEMREQATQTPTREIQTESPCTNVENEIRRESIEPELMAIFQMRQRSARILSNATVSSLGSMYYSSSDSSNTATTSFSESSDRSFSISSDGRDRSSSTSRSFSSLGGESIRRYSALKSHRLSNARHSGLHTEVIHEIVNSQAEQFRDLPKAMSEHHESDRRQSDTDDIKDESWDCYDRPRNKLTRSTKTSRLRHRNSRKSKKLAVSQEKRAAKTLAIVLGCFAICWLPFFVITIIRAFCIDCDTPKIVITLVSWLGYFNSACNPFIYTFFNKDFRKALKRIFTCKYSHDIVYL
ncbi:hypothetical protein ACF0H5_009870 [Mactra antiquata]